MFVRSIRLPLKKLLLAGSGVLAVLLVVLIATWRSAAIRADAPLSADGDSNEGRLAFLNAFGWEAVAEPVEIVEVLIPSEFNDTYESYNEIQRQQDYDLWGYAGKRVKRFSYQLTNYPNYAGEVRANVLVYRGKIIGGDICAMEQGGFLHGFLLKS